MSHEVEQMLYVGEMPWHKLGHRFLEAPGLDQAIISAGLDWTVTTEPVFSGNQEQLEAQLTRRSSDNSILGVVGPSYVPLQNSSAFDFFAPFIDGKEATIETAGSLREGKRVFILCKVNRDPMIIKGNDIVEKYILLSNSHDGTLAVRAGFTPVRAVCANTLAMAINSKASKLLRVKHTKNVLNNVEAIRDIMNLANNDFEATAEQYRYLANKGINSQDLETYVKQVFVLPKALQNKTAESDPGSRVLANILPLFVGGRGNDMPEISGTYWAAYNAITEYIQHERGTEANRLDNAWFGQGATLNKRALELALAA